MDYKDFENLEDKIMRTVKTAVRAIDVVNIKNEIADRTEDVLGEVKSKIKEYNKRVEEGQKKLVYKDNLKYINKSPKGKFIGVLKVILGLSGVGFFGLASLGIFLLESFFMQYGAGVFTIFILGTFFGSVVLLFNGINQLNRIKRFKKYIKFLDDDSFFAIKDLADFMHEKERFIVKDLRKMIRENMFLEGRIDEEEKYFLLNNEVYKNYLEMKKKQEEEAKKQIKSEREKVKEVKSEEDYKVEAIIKEGRSSISKIKNIDSEIRIPEISIKLNKMQGIIHQILNHIEKHPKKINEVNKFINHYLPITIKLLTSYRDLNNQSHQGENIKNAKIEIEHSIDVVNDAFENLLDDLFEDMAMDISTDISVLKTLFKQEGLTEENDFENKF